MTRVISIEDLKGLFTKPYGTDAPTKQKWAEFYNENVTFTDPTQETEGLDAYVKAQKKLVKVLKNSQEVVLHSCRHDIIHEKDEVQKIFWDSIDIFLKKNLS